MFLIFQLFDVKRNSAFKLVVVYFLFPGSITCCCTKGPRTTRERHPFNILGDKKYWSVVSEIFSCFLFASLVTFQKASSTKENRLAKQVPFDIQIALTIWAPGVISVKYLLVISLLYKTQWSWESRTWSHKMNLIDASTNSPHYMYFYWKRIGMANEDLNFVLWRANVNRSF